MRLTKPIKKTIKESFIKRYFEVNKEKEFLSDFQDKLVACYIKIWEAVNNTSYVVFEKELDKKIAELMKVIKPAPNSVNLHKRVDTRITFSVINMENNFSYEDRAIISTYIASIKQEENVNSGSLYTRAFPVKKGLLYFQEYGKSLENILQRKDFYNWPETVALHSSLLQAKERAEVFNKAINEIEAILHKVTTSKNLIKLWPEAKELLPPEPEKPSLPAIPVARLNKQFGLPSNKQS